MSEKILVLGALGQIGTDLVQSLRELYGTDNVIASDLRKPAGEQAGPFVELDATDGKRMNEVVNEFGVSQIYHLVAMLSATAEKFPNKGWDLNMKSLFNVLDLARDGRVRKVFWPSSIAAFGPTTPSQNTPQHTIMDPTTVYGISKLSGELWCNYYFLKYGVDVRSLRYPGLISYKTEPGGGTTDYAVDIFHKALKTGSYECYLDKDTVLPMMYMPDAIKATITIMEAPAHQVKLRTSYNVAAFSFDPQTLSERIKSRLPQFNMSYKVDSRNDIARSWPQIIDDTEAREHWGWQPNYLLNDMVDDMLDKLSED